MIKNRIVQVLCTILLATLFSGCFLLPKEEEILAPPIMEPPEITYKTIPVVRKDIVDARNVTGYFVYADQKSIQFRNASGRLKEIKVEYGDVVTEGQLLAELITNNLALQITEQKIRVRKAELAKERKVLTQADRFELESADLDLQLANLSLQQMENQLESARLRSPMEGEVVYIANVSEGDTIDSYKTMFQIADRSKLYLSFTGSTINEFGLGMNVTVRYNNEDYQGEVIMTPAQFPYDVPETQRRQILIRVDDLPDTVQKGESARIELIKDSAKDVLVIPRSQLQRYLARVYVYVLEDGIRVERNIGTGIENATEVEVTEGLEEGELVILR